MNSPDLPTGPVDAVWAPWPWLRPWAVLGPMPEAQASGASGRPALAGARRRAWGGSRVSRGWGWPPMGWNWELDSRQIQIINTRFLNVSQVQPLESYDIYIDQRRKQRSAKCQDKNSRNSCCNGSPIPYHFLIFPLDFQIQGLEGSICPQSGWPLAMKIRPRDAIRGCMLLGFDQWWNSPQTKGFYIVDAGSKLMFMLKSTIYDGFGFNMHVLKPQLRKLLSQCRRDKRWIDALHGLQRAGYLAMAGAIRWWFQGILPLKSSRIGCIVLYPILSRYQMISHLVVAYISIII